MYQIDSPLDQQWILLLLLTGYSIVSWVPQHPYVQICVAQPNGSFSDIVYSTQYYLGVELVGQMLHHMAFNRDLGVEDAQIVPQLIIPCDYYALAAVVIFGTACPSHHLEDVLLGELYPFALLRGVHLGAFDDDCVGWEVDTPS